MTTDKVESRKSKVESQHTPGPWINGHRHPCRIIAGGFLVASTCEVPDEGTESDTQIANACLIAAAPDLLAACKQAHLQIAKLANRYMSGEVMRWLRDNEAYQATFAAIAKAEGRAE